MYTYIVIWRDSTGPSLAFGLFRGDVGFIGLHSLVGKQVLETKTFQLVEWGHGMRCHILKVKTVSGFFFAIWFDPVFGS